MHYNGLLLPYFYLFKANSVDRWNLSTPYFSFGVSDEHFTLTFIVVNLAKRTLLASSWLSAKPGIPDGILRIYRDAL